MAFVIEIDHPWMKIGYRRNRIEAPVNPIQTVWMNIHDPWKGALVSRKSISESVEKTEAASGKVFEKAVVVETWIFSRGSWSDATGKTEPAWIREK